MKKLIELQPAYLLHSRAFRDSSLIVDFITRDYGRVSAVANGARRPKSKSKALLQAFMPLQISLSGKNELKTFRSAELISDPLILKGSYLFGAMYMNELLVRLIHGHEPDETLFFDYQTALVNLSKTTPLESVLRHFELCLLASLGYGVEFCSCADTGENVTTTDFYYFQQESGFVKVLDNEQAKQSTSYSGADLLNIAERDFSASQTRTTAKRIARQILSFHLGDKPLKSRQLFSGANQ